MVASNKRIEGSTPSGGDYAELYFMDADGNPVDEKDATCGEIVELTNDGKMLMSTVFKM